MKGTPLYVVLFPLYMYTKDSRNWILKGNLSLFSRICICHSRTQVQRIAALDSSWAHLGNGLNAHNNPSWLQLYLSACKLLDLCLALPAERVPQFQL